MELSGLKAWSRQLDDKRVVRHRPVTIRLTERLLKAQVPGCAQNRASLRDVVGLRAVRHQG